MQNNLLFYDTPPLQMAREFLPEMLARDSGHIATVASMGGIFVSAQGDSHNDILVTVALLQRTI